jgi:transcriptional regulator with XRE-family HTH domain
MRHPIDVHVGARIKLLRLQRAWSQTALGARVGLTFQQIQKYENGSNRVSVSRLFEMARALRVPISVFFDGLAAEEVEPATATYREPTNVDYDIARLLDHVDDRRVKRQLSALIRALAAVE